MSNAGAGKRVFLFLQGPHGPFFAGLARRLEAAGAEVWRVGFNAGDRAFWPRRDSYIAHDAPAGDWPAHLELLIDRKGVTDIVLYGDTRPVHAAAITAAQARGITVHVFEEGYLRPYWITYERGGANGNSRLMTLSVDEMRARLGSGGDAPRPPAAWGDMRAHVFYGALYHFHVLCRNRAYPHFRSHRGIGVGAEFRLHLRRAAAMPLIALRRNLAGWRIRRGGFPYHLVLLQLAHDSNFRDHGPFATVEEFLSVVLDGFAAGAPPHHHLVFKAHPLENGRAGSPSLIARLARQRGLKHRVHWVDGGKLARLLDEAQSAVTVNSTAGQQALWRGLPLKAFGRAVYAKPEFVSDQPLADFFAAPRPPDLEAYRDFRRFLLATSQLPGGFYSSRGRRQLYRRLVDPMLERRDIYDIGAPTRAADGQHLRAVT